MACPRAVSETRCTWCGTDKLISGCPRLGHLVEDYCGSPGTVGSFGLWEHLGGACRRCHLLVVGMCRDALGDCLYRPREWLPEDVSQTLFCRVLQAAWEPQKGPLGGWLVVIIQRIVTDAVKAAYGRRTRTADVWSESQQAGMPRAALTEDETSDPLQLLIGRDLQDRMMDAVESLPFAERQVVTLRYIEGYTLQELSTTLSIPLATLARRLRKTVTRLAELLGPWDGTGRIAGET